MMKLLSINKVLQHDVLDIVSINESELASCQEIADYDYIIIHGGDGTIRRVIKLLHTMAHNAHFILNPTGSFNVVAKLHRVPTLDTTLAMLAQGQVPQIQEQTYYGLNDEVFLFSAGSMGDLQHIFLSETLRFGLLEKGMTKYLLSAFFLFPVHLVMTPFMLLSKRRFFIFTPLYFVKKFGSFYGEVKEMTIHLENHHNLIELDGDIVTIEASQLTISPLSTIKIVSLK